MSSLLCDPKQLTPSVKRANNLLNAFTSLVDALVDASGADVDGATIKDLRRIVEVAQKSNVTFGNESSVPVDFDNRSMVQDWIVQEALEFIWSSRQRPITVSDVARDLPVTRRTLDRRFSEALGRSVLEEIIRCRMSRAKCLLIATDLTIMQVAKQAGFPSSERMRVSFIEREGIPPQIYRQQMARAS